MMDAWAGDRKKRVQGCPHEREPLYWVVWVHVKVYVCMGNTWSWAYVPSVSG